MPTEVKINDKEVTGWRKYAWMAGALVALLVVYILIAAPVWVPVALFK